MVEGIDKLNQEQLKHFENVARTHKKEYKRIGDPVKVWIDEDSLLCVDYSGGLWFHYTTAGEWY